MDSSTDEASRGTPPSKYLPVSLKDHSNPDNIKKPDSKQEVTQAVLNLGDIELKNKEILSQKKKLIGKKEPSSSQNSGVAKEDDEDLENLSNPLIPKMRVRSHEKPCPNLILRKKKRVGFIESMCEFLKRMIFGPQVQKDSRVISLSGSVEPANYFKNIVKNQKYNIITFIPVVLINQFKFFFNLFFLLIAVSQFIPPLKVGFLFTYIAPLAFVLVLTMLKEAYDDFKRFSRDREANSALYNVITEVGQRLVESSDLKVGMLVEVNANQRIPADLILVYTPDPSGSVFLKTDQMDGETDWKLRKAIRFTQSYISESRNNPSSLITLPSHIVAQEPIEQIYSFNGLFQTNDGSTKESLGLENTLWANCVLASGRIYGIVAYSGKETRMAMNTRRPRTKVGLLDLELNFLSKLLFVFMMALSVIMVFMNGINFSSMQPFIQMFRYVLLLSSIIPISMRVNLDFAKLTYSYKISKDKDIEGTIARNSVIPEELGRIQYLLTDKTGTLTQNDMIFKKLSLEQLQFTYETTDDLQKMVKKNCEKVIGPMSDVDQKIKQLIEKNPEALKNFTVKRLFKREREFIVRDIITALCHNVTPIYESSGEKVYQASSPDEVALVKTTEDLSMVLSHRDQSSMKIINPAGQEETYDILENFPFSSETKRMGIILRNRNTNRIIFYLKGADTIMKNKVPEVQRGFLLDECESLAREGLRTLVISQKFLLEDEYAEWKIRFEEANTSMVNREKKVRDVIESLENNMEFLGITGVEDKLQEDVCHTLENLRNAGINIWMLTGDKIETAICIAISAGIKGSSQSLFLIKEIEDEGELINQLNQFGATTNTVLIIDGASLKVAMERQSKLFFEVSTKAPAVVCCRCSPTQKALVTEGIKSSTKKKTAAIGDGGNDVGMIQQADVGIGIEGKEGKQASLAADYSILKFKYLNKLILWHGRLSYKRSAILSQFVIHRGLIISVIQAVFTSVFYFVAIPIYNGMLMLGYSTIYTVLPVFSLVFDEDIDVKTALSYPPLYKTLQSGREMNVKTFIIWCWKSLYQGLVIMLLGLYMFDQSFINIVTITFSALILTEFLNIYSELSSFHIIMIVSQVLSVILYFASIMLLNTMFSVAYITWQFLGKIILITLISWLPLHLVKIIKRRVQPSDYEKIMRGMGGRRRIITNIV